MPTNKHAAFRYRVLDKCFRERRWSLEALEEYVSAQLNEHFGTKGKPISIKKRSLQGDIQVMRKDPPEGYGAPIVCEDGLYFYADTSFSINKSPVSEQDKVAMKEALSILQQFSDLPHYSFLKAALTNLQGMTDSPVRTVVMLETNNQYAGLHNIRPLYSAIIAQKEVFLHYEPFDDEIKRMFFHPYLLKEYKNRWFVFGLNPVDATIWNFALDRITRIEPQKKQFELSADWDAERYFRDIIGVTNYEKEEAEKYLIRAVPKLGKYLHSKPLHHSQTLVSRTKEYWEFEFFLKANYEWAAELRGMGRQLVSVEPSDILDSGRF